MQDTKIALEEAKKKSKYEMYARYKNCLRGSKKIQKSKLLEQLRGKDCFKFIDTGHQVGILVRNAQTW